MAYLHWEDGLNTVTASGVRAGAVRFSSVGGRMQLGEELSQWLGSSARLSCSRELRAAIKKKHDESARLVALVDALERCQSRPEVSSLIRPLVTEPSWVFEILGDYVDATRADPFFFPAADDVNGPGVSGLTIVRHPKARIAVMSVSTAAQDLAARQSICFSGRFSHLNFIRAADAKLAVWRIDGAGDERRGRLHSVVDAADGYLMELDGRNEAMQIVFASRPVVLLVAEVLLNRGALQSVYSGESGALIGHSAASSSASRNQLLCSFLKASGRVESVDAMKCLFDHDDFFVRWHAMREALLLDAAAAMASLERMASHDSDPRVARAAQRTLSKIRSGQKNGQGD